MAMHHLFTGAVLVGALLTTGCAMQRSHTMGHGAGASPERMAKMCEMHRQTMAGKSPEEQRAAAEAHVRSMHGSAPPEHVSRHMAMMKSHCEAGAAPRTY